MSQITSHVLDTSLGKPGSNLHIELQAMTDDTWQTIGSGLTDDDGRVSTLLADDQILAPGNYQLLFHTGSYYEAQAIASFYPEVRIQFRVIDASHYHVPLLLNPFGYSTYRGS
ncbi:MAG: hydroxyisourate hydrolase [Saprospiraceae bacterium]